MIEEKMAVSIAALGKAIRKQRRDFSLTQKQLAELSNTSLNFVSQLERGKVTVQLSSLLAVLQVLGLELKLQRGKSFVFISSDL